MQGRVKVAWAAIRAGLTEADIVRAHATAEASTEALERYQRHRPI